MEGERRKMVEKWRREGEGEDRRGGEERRAAEKGGGRWVGRGKEER